jgi:hypothetical protein
VVFPYETTYMVKLAAFLFNAGVIGLILLFLIKYIIVVIFIVYFIGVDTILQFIDGVISAL